MPLIRKRKVWWEPVSGATSYVVYVSKDDAIFNSPKFCWAATPGVLSKQVAGKTELVIPDEWPEFPQEQGIYHIGITSKDEAENESDPFVSSGLFKLFAPPPPVKGGIESQ
jgi:hypothetical protein